MIPSNFRAIKLKPKRKLTCLKPRWINCSRMAENSRIKTLGFVQLVSRIVVKCGKFSATATTPIFFIRLSLFRAPTRNRAPDYEFLLEIYCHLQLNVNVRFLIGFLTLPCITPASAIFRFSDRLQPSFPHFYDKYAIYSYSQFS